MALIKNMNYLRRQAIGNQAPIEEFFPKNFHRLVIFNLPKTFTEIRHGDIDGDTEIPKDGFFDKEKSPCITYTSSIGCDDEPDSVIPQSTKDSVPNNVPSSIPNIPYANILPSSNSNAASIQKRPIPNSPGYRPIPDLESLPDVTVYHRMTTLAQVMMGFALLSANINQLKYFWESSDRHPYFYPSVVLIIISLLLQIVIGVALIWSVKYNVDDKKELSVASKLNNSIFTTVFFVLIINVIISIFKVAPYILEEITIL